MILPDEIALLTNITIELGNEVYKFHNIYLNYGREWLLKLMCYSAAGPPNVMENNRVCFMGFGIGGNRQVSTIPDSVAAAYPGTNAQDGDDPTIQYLERPVRVKVVGADHWWLQNITHSETMVTSSPPYYARFQCAFSETEISFSPYYIVPLSEIGLFEYGQLDHQVAPLDEVYGSPPIRPQPISYATFWSINKTASVPIVVTWDVRLS